MKVVFPMAGIGSRFRNAGYNCEKYEIEWNGKSLFEHSLDSMSDFFDEEIIFIGRSSTNFVEFIYPKLIERKIRNYRFISLDHQTSGQAETVYEFTKNLLEDDSLLIFNIDTYIKPFVVKKSDINTNYWWLVSELDGEKWSFIKINDDGSFTTSEKKRISNHASLGMYFFHSLIEYNNIFNLKKEEIKEKWKEIYIAPMFNYVQFNNSISIKSIVEGKDFKTLGTPEELKSS